jgi:hypothetical protein
VEANYGIPNNRENRWMAELIQREIIFSKDVDSRQELGDDFPSFHFTHRNPIIDIRLASEIEADLLPAHGLFLCILFYYDA